MKGEGNILTSDRDDLAEMSVESFLFLTKHGKSLSIIDGLVIDIGTFVDVHPGGTNVLGFAIGSDITSYFIGDSDIEGQRHKHSLNALKALRSLVKWKLENDQNGNASNQARGQRVGKRLSERNSRTNSLLGSMQKTKFKSTLLGHVFRNGLIVQNEAYTNDETAGQKSVVKISIALKREEGMDLLLGTPLPTSTFIFRKVDRKGNALERPYNASRCYIFDPKEDPSSNTVLPLYRARNRTNPSMVVYEFFITIVPGGKMSSFLAKKSAGRHIMVKGPLANEVRL